MPQRELVWSEEAIAQVATLLDRRDDRTGVLDCIEAHLLAVAADSSIAWADSGPQEFLLYRFGCRDGETHLYLQAEMQDISDDLISLVACGAIAL